MICTRPQPLPTIVASKGRDDALRSPSPGTVARERPAVVVRRAAEARRRVDAAAQLAGGAAWEVVETPPGRTGPEDHPALAEKLRHAGAALMRGGEEGRGNSVIFVITQVSMRTHLH